MNRERIVTIDGPSGAGKSTVARLVARHLGYIYIDTGAMYRAFGLRAERDGIDFDDDAAVRAACASVSIRLVAQGDALRTVLDGVDVSEAIRTPEASMAASRWSAHPEVRRTMTRLQRSLAESSGVVMEGRDIGTVVFPDAAHKFYLTASEKERARRRHAELAHSMDSPPPFNEVLADIRRRDANDSSREHAPMAEPADAVCIDSTEMTIDEVVGAILARIQSAADAR